jgi:hypothetical protein
MEIGVQLGVGSWVRNRADETPISLINRFFENNPTNTDEQVGLIERPALIGYLEAGDGPGRRLYRQPGFSNGDLFHVSGTELYKHHMESTRTVTTTQIPGLIDGVDLTVPDMAATPNYLWIADGFSLQYTDGTTALAAIATPDDIPIISLDIFNEYVLCVQNDSDRFYWIQPDAIVIDPLDFATAERFPDKVFQVRVVGDEFWLLGESSIEVWRATGDADAPFQRIDGRAFNFGIFDGTAVRMPDTSVLCIAGDGTAYQIAGNPTPIGNPAIAEKTRNAILDAKEAGI